MEMIRLEFSLLCICVFVCICYCVVTNRVRFARSLDLNNRNDDRFTLSSSPASNPLECAALCKSSPDCKSYFFRHSDGTCDLKTVLYIQQSDTTEEQGTVYYYVLKGGSGWCPSSEGYASDATGRVCVKFSTEQLAWDDANTTCYNQTLSSRLIIIGTQLKLQRLLAIAASEGITSTAYFLGMQETSTDVYAWADGSSLSITPTWHTADYSTPEVLDCVHVIASTWKWVKAPCNVTRRYICELTISKEDYEQVMFL